VGRGEYRRCGFGVVFVEVLVGKGFSFKKENEYLK
jgi:hypothetical protein